MKTLNNIKIKTRMIIALSAIVSFFVLFGAVTLYEVSLLSELTTTLYEHPLRVSNAALAASLEAIKMQWSMKNVILSESEIERQDATHRIWSSEEEVYHQLDIVRQQILGDEGKKLENETRKAFQNWKSIRDEIITHAYNGDKKSALKISRERGGDYVQSLEQQFSSLTAYARNKADGFIKEAESVGRQILYTILGFILCMALLSAIIGYLLLSSIISSISGLRDTMAEITKSGELSRADITGNNEITEMAIHFNMLIDTLKNQFWLRETLNVLNKEITGNVSHEDIANKSLAFLSRAVEACAGALYLCTDEDLTCRLKSSYAYVERKYLSNEFRLGHGVVGQVAVEKSPILLTSISSEEAVGVTGTISEPPKNIYAVPLLFENELFGVLEIASFDMIGKIKREFIDSAAQIIATSLFTSYQNARIQELLKTTEEANAKLLTQTRELETQSEELKALNMEFQQQALELQAQNDELEVQRSQVEAADRLKSEFLSNMSHELRTPLNSIMALSRVLIMQTKQRLSTDEIKYLEIVERNGKHLLSLINDILDLSKIEAGRMDVQITDVPLYSLISDIVENQQPISDEKGIEIINKITSKLPNIESDEARVHQILQNVIGNAVKFTASGSVTISAKHTAGWIQIVVEDTGIGIPEDEIPNIFTEFRQVDGSSSRRFEGSGLGLAIAYKAVKILGGNISVSSEYDKGSVFTVSFPIQWHGEGAEREAVESVYPVIEEKERKTILVVDDEPGAAAMISSYLRQEGYDTVIANGGKQALDMAKEHMPFAITLDVMMPDMDGWEVIQELKRNTKTSGIPVIMISVSDDRETGFALGAAGYITKPIRREILTSEFNKLKLKKPLNVMIVDDNEIDRKHMARIVNEEGFIAITASGGKEFLNLIETSKPDILILDLMMPEMNGYDIIEKMRWIPSVANMPVIVVTAKDLTNEDKRRLEGKVCSIMEKNSITSTLLLNQIKCFLNNIEMMHGMNKTVTTGGNNRILLVEDNDTAIIQVKNTLEEAGYEVDVAENGEKALKYMKENIPIGIVLDLMMPEIDGFEVLENMRSTPATANVPVLILTAKDLTKSDMKRLSANNIQQLVQKGDVNRKELIDKIGRMIGKKAAAPVKAPSYLYVRGKKTCGGKPVILIIEDNPDNMTTLKAILQDKYIIREAMDGETGLKMAFEDLPDVILLDISLPGMDGFQVVKQIKSNYQAIHIPVIALTAKAMKGDKEKVLAAGCNDYISKPIDPETIMSTLDRWLNRA